MAFTFLFVRHSTQLFWDHYENVVCKILELGCLGLYPILAEDITYRTVILYAVAYGRTFRRINWHLFLEEVKERCIEAHADQNHLGCSSMHGDVSWQLNIGHTECVTKCYLNRSQPASNAQVVSSVLGV